MSKRRYTNMVALLPIIEKMLAAGMSHRAIETELSLEGDRPVHNLLKRQRRKAAKGMPKVRGGKLRPDAGLCSTVPWSRYPVGQQEVHEYEALRGDF